MKKIAEKSLAVHISVIKPNNGMISFAENVPTMGLKSLGLKPKHLKQDTKMMELLHILKPNGMADIQEQESIVGVQSHEVISWKDNMVVKVDDVEDAGWDNLGDLLWG